MIEFVEDQTPITKTLRSFRDRVSSLIAQQVEQALSRETFIRVLTSLAVDAKAEGVRDAMSIASKMCEIEGVACWGGGFNDRFHEGYQQALRDLQQQLSSEYQDKNGFIV